MDAMTVLLTGLLTCLALIVAIGPQSVWLLRQGLRRDRVMLAIGCCLVGDLLLIGLGVAGVGVVLDHAPWLLDVIRWLGVAYLLWFAAGSFRSAFRSAFRPRQSLDLTDRAAAEQAGTPTTQPLRTVHVEMDSEQTPDAGSPADAAAGAPAGSRPATGTLEAVRVTKVSSVTSVAATGLTVSVLNPHAWVDTMVVLGTMANTFGDERWLFGAGAALASAAWFAVLGLGAAGLSRFLNSSRTWTIIDLAVGVTMVGVAGLLAVGGF